MSFKHFDKFLHFSAGALFSSCGFVWEPLFALGFIAGMAKEVWDDKSQRGTSDVADCWATWVGAGMPLFVWLIQL